MEQLIPELLKQTGLGIVAGIFFWLYKVERDDHNATRAKVEALMEARRLDARETLEKIEEPLSSMALSTKFIADKIITVKRRT